MVQLTPQLLSCSHLQCAVVLQYLKFEILKWAKLHKSDFSIKTNMQTDLLTQRTKTSTKAKNFLNVKASAKHTYRYIDIHICVCMFLEVHSSGQDLRCCLRCLLEPVTWLGGYSPQRPDHCWHHHYLGSCLVW